MIALALAPGRSEAQPIPDQIAPAGPTTLLLAVSINGWPLQLVARFVEDGSRLRIPASEFDGLGFVVDEAFVSVIGDDRWIYLDEVPGLGWTIDQREQAIDLEAPFDLLKINRIEVAPPQPKVEARADWGAMLAWDVYGQWAVRDDDPLFSRQLAATLDMRVFSPWAVIGNTATVTVSEGAGPRATRLETVADFDNPEKSWRVRLGDSYTGGPVWVRPVRFGGAQWSRDFGLRPDIVTTPVATIGHDVQVPSTVDVFVNGVKRYSQDVGPGRVLLDDLPVNTGSNSISAVITDTSGRRVEVLLPFYATTKRLAKGLSDFSFEAGFPREDFGVESNHYGPGFASGSVGYGINDTLTLRGYLSGTEGYRGLGAGATLGLGNLAEIDGAVLYSRTRGRDGWAFYTGLSRTSQRLTLSASYGRSEEDYFDLASVFRYTRYLERLTGSASLYLGRAGNVSATYIYQRDSADRVTSIATGSWGVDFGRQPRIHVGASGYADTQTGDWGAALTLTVPLGSNVDLYGQESWANGRRTAQLQLQGRELDDRLEWELEAIDGPGGHYGLGAQADWDGSEADIYARVMRIDASSAAEFQLAQSLILMDDRLFIAGRIDDGFTVVDVEDSPGVAVSLENRVVGHTSRSGKLLLTDLQSYTGNAVSIDPLDLPRDAEISESSLLVAPRGRSGMVTRFAVTRARAAIVRLLLPDGQPPPVGAGVRLVPDGDERVLGFDGEAYLRGLVQGPNELEVTWENGRCSARFMADIADGTVPTLGPFTCAP